MFVQTITTILLLRIWFFTVILEAAASVALADLLELRAAPELLVRLIIFGLPLASELRTLEHHEAQGPPAVRRPTLSS